MPCNPVQVNSCFKGTRGHYLQHWRVGQEKKTSRCKQKFTLCTNSRLACQVKVKVYIAIPVTGCGDPQSYKLSRLPHFLGKWLTDGGKVASLTHQLATLYAQEDSWYSFLSEAASTPGHSTAGRIRSTEKSNDLIRNQTHHLLAYSIVLPTTLLCAPNMRLRQQISKTCMAKT
jgi:hypothetical protein